MQIQINTPGEKLPDAFLEQIETSLHEVLRPHEAHLTRVEVHLRDLNGNKGGIDKRCLIEARPRGMQPLVAEEDVQAILLPFILRCLELQVRGNGHVPRGVAAGQRRLSGPGKTWRDRGRWWAPST